MSRVVWMSLFMLVLTGCAAGPERSTPAPILEATSTDALRPDLEDKQYVEKVQPQVQVQPLEVTAYRPPESMPAEPDSAVAALLEEARRQQRSGLLQHAAATLERALRIEPRNPRLWNRLAHVRMDQGRIALAGHLAAKSNALASGDPALMRDNWLIIARARQVAGDAAGARSAQRQADSVLRSVH